MFKHPPQPLAARHGRWAGQQAMRKPRPTRPAHQHTWRLGAAQASVAAAAPAHCVASAKRFGNYAGAGPAWLPLGARATSSAGPLARVSVGRSRRSMTDLTTSSVAVLRGEARRCGLLHPYRSSAHQPPPAFCCRRLLRTRTCMHCTTTPRTPSAAWGRTPWCAPTAATPLARQPTQPARSGRRWRGACGVWRRVGGGACGRWRAHVAPAPGVRIAGLDARKQAGQHFKLFSAAIAVSLPMPPTPAPLPRMKCMHGSIAAGGCGAH